MSLNEAEEENGSRISFPMIFDLPRPANGRHYEVTNRLMFFLYKKVLFLWRFFPDWGMRPIADQREARSVCQT
jgi:hypothetical protein